MARTDWSDQQGAIIVSWKGIVRGREGKAFDVFGRAVEYYGGLEKSGTISGTQVYFNNTGGANGMIILNGRIGELHKLMLDADFSKLQMEGSLVADDFEVNVAMGGGFDSVGEGMTANYEVLKEHSLV